MNDIIDISLILLLFFFALMQMATKQSFGRGITWENQDKNMLPPTKTLRTPRIFVSPPLHRK